MVNRILFLELLLIAAMSLNAQSGMVITDEVHFASLEGNLVGDSPKRTVIVYLPPGYEQDKKMRYSVVYLLHGFNGYGDANRQSDEALKRNGIEHSFEIFEGGHTDKTRQQIETKMLPFLSGSLVSAGSGTKTR